MVVFGPEIGCAFRRRAFRRSHHRFAREPRVVLLVEILAGQALVIDRRGKDRFGRTLAYIRVSGADVGEMLIRARVAVRWEGRQHMRKRSRPNLRKFDSRRAQRDPAL